MPFELWRQDDNGNRFLIGVYPDRPSAELRLEELSRYPHKQTYWISECPGKSGSGADLESLDPKE